MCVCVPARGPVKTSWCKGAVGGSAGTQGNGGGRVGGRAGQLWGRPSRHPAADELGRLSPSSSEPACCPCTLRQLSGQIR
jgi:hypothetical protein